MISVEEALLKIEENINEGSITSVHLYEANGLVLAKDIFSPIDMPPFQQSAMDGYAIKFNGSSEFNLIGEVKAGDAHQPELSAGQAVRIFTGAAVPNSSDAVVKQEDTSTDEQLIQVHILPADRANIRPQGEQIKKGSIALKKGHELTTASIGFLAGLGIEKVEVYNRPRVALLVTGNELIKPGKELAHGQIYESNASMLLAALEERGMKNIAIYKVKDEYEATKSQLQRVIRDNDLILSSGGISVGDYDFVGKALNELGVQEVFYKVKQKPGKPLYFGKIEEKLVFALPGNPAAALTCFYVYVVKALNLMMHKRSEGLRRKQKVITSDFNRKGDRAQFLKAAICGEEVAVLEGQSSAMLHTYAQSNALVYVPLGVESLRKGQEVETILLK